LSFLAVYIPILVKIGVSGAKKYKKEE